MSLHSADHLEILRAAYRQAVESPVEQFASLSQLDFCTDFGASPSAWRIGPFVRDPALTFYKSQPMEDPTGIGWGATILGNPTLIEWNGDLHMFYRAYPRKESISTRIGHAVHNETAGWTDLSGPPVLYPTEPDELWSVEDAKIYRNGDTFYMFYNSVWNPDAETAAAIRRGARDWGVIVVTKLAVSKDLQRFEKLGQVVPYEISRGWSKGAVIPRNSRGEAVRIGGKFLMFLSEGCGDEQFIGYSDDLITWEFKQQTYLTLPAEMGLVSEVACCVAEFEPTGKYFLLDVFYKIREHDYRAAQALYHVDDPTQPLAIEPGGSLAWGGLLKYRDRWLVAQGWDSPAGSQEIQIYAFAGNPSPPR
jgi:predicted GH43/DUF377 family glycosyl hydrolase